MLGGQACLILHVAPRSLAVNQLGFVEAVYGFREGVVVVVTNAADRWFDTGFGWGHPPHQFKMILVDPALQLILKQRHLIAINPFDGA